MGMLRDSIYRGYYLIKERNHHQPPYMVVALEKPPYMGASPVNLPDYRPYMVIAR